MARARKIKQRTSATVEATAPTVDLSDAETLKLRNRAEELRDLIRYHNRLYYAKDEPEISDPDWDALFQELRSIEERYPQFQTADSPTRQVGAPPETTFDVVQHREPMLSLGNVFDGDGVREWHRRASELANVDDFAMVTEPKIDGLAMALVYENGKLIRAATRGDGRHGEDVTPNILTIQTLPHQLTGKPPPLLEVRGEVYMPASGFEAMNRAIEEENLQLQAEERPTKRLFSNPRNAAAGAVRQKDPAVTRSRPLAIGIYQLGWSDGPSPATHWETLNWLSDFGLPTAPLATLQKGIDPCVATCEAWVAKRDGLDFDIDGVVV